MRRLFCVLIGVVLVGGAVSMFGVRQGGWEVHAHAYRDSGSSRWALERSVGAPHSLFSSHEPRPWFSEREEPRSWFTALDPRSWFSDRRRSVDPWFNVGNALDMINLLVGVAGICLTISGMRAAPQVRRRG